MTRSQHHQRPDRVLFSTQHKIRRRVKWFYITLTIALRFTTGCPSAKATAATRTLPAVHRTRPRLCDSTGAHIHPGTERTACSGRCRCYPRCAANPRGTGPWTPPHPRSPPPRQEARRRENAHVVGEENPAEAAARELPARAGPVGRRGAGGGDPRGQRAAHPHRAGPMRAPGGGGEAAPCVRGEEAGCSAREPRTRRRAQRSACLLLRFARPFC